MRKLDANGGLSPRFDAFLFAPVGEDRKGMLVSVLSALARFDVDPWKVAESLADLPHADAADRLDDMILALADVPSAVANHREISTRLIALLPQASTIKTGLREAVGLTALAPRNQIILWVAVMLIVLIGQAVAPRPDVGASGGDASSAMSAPLARPSIQTP